MMISFEGIDLNSTGRQGLLIFGGAGADPRPNHDAVPQEHAKNTCDETNSE